MEVNNLNPSVGMPNISKNYSQTRMSKPVSFKATAPQLRQSNYGIKSVFQKIQKYMQARKKLLELCFHDRSIKPLQSSFKSADEMTQYATTRILEYLHSDNPIEYEVLMSSRHNKVLSEFHGVKDCCCPSGVKNFINLFTPNNKLISMHGHLTLTESGHTAPISMQDFISLNLFEGLYKQSVINAAGEFSTLEKLKDYKQLSKKEIKTVDLCFLRCLSAHMPQTLKSKLIKLGDQYSKEPSQELTDEWNKIIYDFQKSKDGIVAIHNFWLKMAPKLHLKYETNYSYL